MRWAWCLALALAAAAAAQDSGVESTAVAPPPVVTPPLPPSNPAPEQQPAPPETAPEAPAPPATPPGAGTVVPTRPDNAAPNNLESKEPPRTLGAPPAAGTVARHPAKGKKSAHARREEAAQARGAAPDTGRLLNVDYVNEPILNVLRSIGTAYGLSIVPDSDLGDVKVTIHLEKIPVLEGLDQICSSHGLDFVRTGDVFHVQRHKEIVQSVLQMHAGKMSVDVKNAPVREFLREFGEKTGINVVPGQGLDGTVSGQLRDVRPLDGLKALMAANNFSVHIRSGVYLVEAEEGAEPANPAFPGRRRFLPGAGGNGDVDVHDGKVTLTCHNSALADVVREIAEQAGLNYSVISDLSGTVNAQMRDVPVEEALAHILTGTRFTFINRQGTLLVGDRNPNTPSGQALSGADLVFLKYTRAENALKLLPKALQDNATVVKEQNALLIAGTGEDIEQAKEFIGKIDLPTPQVMLEVVVVEYNLQHTAQFGVAAGKSSNEGPNLNVETSLSGVRDAFQQGSFRGAIGILPPTFDLSLNALESEDRARVLAEPKITTLNGNKAQLQVTRTSYYEVSSVTKDGFQNNDFRAIDDGITIELTPWITQHGDVNVDITPTIKTAGQAVSNSPAPITNRSISTNVDLMDGETIALGGLITSQEDSQRKFVPILGSIPLLKWLFSYHQDLKVTTELVIYVTPHILRPEQKGVNMAQEFKAMDRRNGQVKPEDIIPVPTPAVAPKRAAPDSSQP